MSGLGLTFLRRGGQAHPTAGSDYILAENRGDPEVFRVLMLHGVSKDGVGITKEDAARVTSIGTWFKGNTTITSFNELQYFTSVKSIEQDAFNGCSNLVTISLVNVEIIGNQAFIDCKNLSSPLYAPSLKSIGSASFTRTGIQRVDNIGMVSTLPNGFWASGRVGVFTECSAEVVVLPETLTSIGYGAFSRCRSMKRIMLPSSLITIGEGAFESCIALESIDIPENAIALGNSTFENASGMQYMICRAATPPSANYYTLKTNNDCPLYVPDASVDAYKAAAGWSSWVSRIRPLSEFQG